MRCASTVGEDEASRNLERQKGSTNKKKVNDANSSARVSETVGFFVYSK